ncbi:MAG: methyltransferase domain-containing protein [Candidatus Daviesbacteria bacterium]|nr:methyltransferase domain-containing protein [Candidatus Daviesbacteria bacterium]
MWLESIRENHRNSVIKRYQDQLFDESIAWHQGKPVRYNDPLKSEEYKAAFGTNFGSSDLLKGQRFLDVGRGFGSNLHDALSELGVDIVNLDVSDLTTALFKATLNEEGVCGSAFNLPFLDNSFDGILSVNFLNSEAVSHYLDLEDSLQQIHRVLKPKGLFVQSNFGGWKREDYLKAIAKTGFTNVKVIDDPKDTSDYGSLIFIAEKAERPWKPEDKRYISGEEPKSADEQMIREFCTGCYFFDPVNNLCRVFSKNDQARLTRVENCDEALVNGVKGFMTEVGFTPDSEYKGTRFYKRPREKSLSDLFNF